MLPVDHLICYADDTPLFISSEAIAPAILSTIANYLAIKKT